MTCRYLILLASANLLGCFSFNGCESDSDCTKDTAYAGTRRIDEECEPDPYPDPTSGAGGMSGISGGIGSWSGDGGETGGSGGVAGVTGGSGGTAGMTGGSGGVAADSGIDDVEPCEECIWIDCNVEVNACVDEGECISIFECALDSACSLDDDECIDTRCEEIQSSLVADDLDLEALDGLQRCLEDRCATSCTNGVCIDTCEFAGDGVCDDGGPESDFGACEFGTDCADCGPR
jgi:hypothetical protein